MKKIFAHSMEACFTRGIEVDLEKIFPFLVEEEVFQRISQELRYWPRMTSHQKEDRVNYLKEIMREVEAVGGKRDFLRMISRHLESTNLLPEEIRNYSNLSF